MRESDWPRSDQVASPEPIGLAGVRSHDPFPGMRGSTGSLRRGEGGSRGWGAGWGGVGSWSRQASCSSWSIYSMSGLKGPRAIVQPRSLRFPRQRRAQGHPRAQPSRDPARAAVPSPIPGTFLFIQRSQTFAKHVILKCKPSANPSERHS